MWLSARATLSGDRVTCLFTAGVFSIMKICVAPESATASFIFRVTLAVARACITTDWVVPFNNIIEVITVTLSSSQLLVVVAEYWVG
jgi:hypothetical protein